MAVTIVNDQTKIFQTYPKWEHEIFREKYQFFIHKSDDLYYLLMDTDDPAKFMAKFKDYKKDFRLNKLCVYKPNDLKPLEYDLPGNGSIVQAAKDIRY